MRHKPIHIILLAFLVGSNPVFAGQNQLACKINAFFNWQPHYLSDTGQHVGPLVSYINAAALQSGFTIDLQSPKPSMRVFRDLEEGRIDAILSGMMTERRRGQFIISDHVFLIRNGLASLSKKETVPLEDARLISFRVFRNMRPLDPVKNRAKLIIEAETLLQAVKMLQENRADYMLVDLYTIRKNLADLSFEPTLLKLHPEYSVNTKAYMMFHKQSRCLPLIDHLNRYMANQKYEVVTDQSMASPFEHQN